MPNETPQDYTRFFKVQLANIYYWTSIRGQLILALNLKKKKRISFFLYAEHTNLKLIFFSSCFQHYYFFPCSFRIQTKWSITSLPHSRKRRKAALVEVGVGVDEIIIFPLSKYRKFVDNEDNCMKKPHSLESVEHSLRK